MPPPAIEQTAGRAPKRPDFLFLFVLRASVRSPDVTRASSPCWRRGSQETLIPQFSNAKSTPHGLEARVTVTTRAEARTTNEDMTEDTVQNARDGPAPPRPPLLIGVDVGGTFTDLVAYDPADGSLRVVKVPSTPPDFHRAVIEAVRRVAPPRDAGRNRPRLDRRDQRPAPAGRRAGRVRHHRGLPRHAPDRPAEPAEPLRAGDRPPPAADGGGELVHRPRADRREWRRRPAARPRRGGPADRPDPCARPAARRCVPAVQLHQLGPRAVDRRAVAGRPA